MEIPNELTLHLLVYKNILIDFVEIFDVFNELKASSILLDREAKVVLSSPHIFNYAKN